MHTIMYVFTDEIDYLMAYGGGSWDVTTVVGICPVLSDVFKFYQKHIGLYQRGLQCFQVSTNKLYKVAEQVFKEEKQINLWFVRLCALKTEEKPNKEMIVEWKSNEAELWQCAVETLFDNKEENLITHLLNVV